MANVHVYHDEENGRFSKCVYVRVLDVDHAKMTQAAHDDGRKLADWARRVLVAEANVTTGNVILFAAAKKKKKSPLRAKIAKAKKKYAKTHGMKKKGAR